MRIGGFDQIVSNRTSARHVVGRTHPDVRDPVALRRSPAHSSRARSLTSIAHTVASGERRAIVSAIGPAPQPTIEHVAGRHAAAGSVRSSNDVPASS